MTLCIFIQNSQISTKSPLNMQSRKARIIEKYAIEKKNKQAKLQRKIRKSQNSRLQLFVDFVGE